MWRLKKKVIENNKIIHLIFARWLVQMLTIMHYFLNDEKGLNIYGALFHLIIIQLCYYARGKQLFLGEFSSAMVQFSGQDSVKEGQILFLQVLFYSKL